MACGDASYARFVVRAAAGAMCLPNLAIDGNFN